ncbi:unnamed protein product, partial [Staurois parvus]
VKAIISPSLILAAIEKYCESCDWSQLVTWHKAVVNNLVPCDLCDHSQISQVVSNDVRSDILFTAIHRGPVQRSVFRCVWRIHRERAQAVNAGAVYKWQPSSALLPSGCLSTWAGWEVV